MADHVHSDTSSEFPPPPECLGLEWRESITRMTGYGPRRVSKALPTAVFAAMWGHPLGESRLRQHRFSLDSRSGHVVHWGREDATTGADVEASRLEVLARIEADRVEADRVSADLTDRVDRHWWTVSRQKLAEAQARLREDLTSMSNRRRAEEAVGWFVEGHLKAARAVEAARAALDPATVARFADVTVRDDVRVACHLLSQQDDDRATQRNAAGWSKSTSGRGHWLHEVGQLTPDLAAVGYALAEVHRKQLRRLDADLSRGLFGAAA